MFFNNAKYFAFVDDCRNAGINIPIIPGLKPFSAKTQLSMLPQVFHIDLPEELVSAVTECKDTEAVRQVGVEWATKQAKELIKRGVPAIHFYTMGRSDNVVKIARQAF